MKFIKLNLNLKYGIIILVSLIALISWSNYGYGQNLSSNNNSVVSDTFPDINGTYINSDIGYQIDLPKDWQGKEVNFFMNMLFASPHGVNFSKIAESSGTWMTITVIPKQFLQGNDSSSNPTFGSMLDSCKDYQKEFITINGIRAEQTIQDCIDDFGERIEAKQYKFATNDDSLIVIGFSSSYNNGTLNNEYNQYLPFFEDSVKTIKITNPGDITKSETLKKLFPSPGP